jgi:transposase
MVDVDRVRTVLSQLRDDPDQLIEINVQQALLIDELRREIERLKSDNDDHKRRLAELERAAYRQAAPFRIDAKKRKTTRKKPGRPKGHPGAYRAQPTHVDDAIDVPLDACPHCGGRVYGVTRVDQFIEDIPRIRPHVTHLRTYEGACPRCGEVRSTHPLQVSTATGAARTHLGPNALGLALELTQQHGLPKRQTSRILERAFGLTITPGGLVQAAHRLAGKVHAAYEAVAQGVRRAPAVYADETSWWVGGPTWWLWVFTHPAGTLYGVREGRGRAIVHETLGADFPGVLVSDCLASYDDATAVQHKCYGHHHKAIGDAIAQHPRGGEGFLRNVRALLLAAQALKAQKATLPDGEFARMRRALERSADPLLASATVEPLEQRIANRLRKQRDHLFTFLDHDAVDATNNRAERQLRPAVIARKLSCGNRTPHGARTWEVLTSLAATCTQTGESFRHIIANAARLPPPSPAR